MLLYTCECLAACVKVHRLHTVLAEGAESPESGLTVSC